MLVSDKEYAEIQNEFRMRWRKFTLTVNDPGMVDRQMNFVKNLLKIAGYHHRKVTQYRCVHISDISPLILSRAKSMSLPDDIIKAYINASMGYTSYLSAYQSVIADFNYAGGSDDLYDLITKMRIYKKKAKTDEAKKDKVGRPKED